MVSTKRDFDSDQAFEADRKLEGLIDGYIVEASDARREAKKTFERSLRRLGQRLDRNNIDDYEIANLTIAYVEAYQAYRDILDEEIHARRGQVMRHQKQRYYERTGYYYGRTDAEIDD